MYQVFALPTSVCIRTPTDAVEDAPTLAGDIVIIYCSYESPNGAYISGQSDRKKPPTGNQKKGTACLYNYFCFAVNGMHTQLLLFPSFADFFLLCRMQPPHFCISRAFYEVGMLVAHDSTAWAVTVVRYPDEREREEAEEYLDVVHRDVDSEPLARKEHEAQHGVAAQGGKQHATDESACPISRVETSASAHGIHPHPACKTI